MFIFFLATAHAGVGTITVTIVDSGIGTGLTEIEYAFTGPAEEYDISAEVRFYDADFEPVNDDFIAGDLNNVPPGVHTLIWDGEQEFPDIYSEETLLGS